MAKYLAGYKIKATKGRGECQIDVGMLGLKVPPSKSMRNYIEMLLHWASATAPLETIPVGSIHPPSNKLRMPAMGIVEGPGSS